MQCNIKIKKETVISVVKTLCLVMWPLMTIFLTHYIQYQYLWTTLSWMFNNIGLVFLEYILLYGCFEVVTSIFNKHSVGYFFTTFFSLILSLISFLKYEIKGEVLQVADVNFLENIGGVTSFVDLNSIFRWKLILPLIVAVIFGIVFSKLIGKKKLNLKNRLLRIGIPIVILGVLFGTKFSQNNLLPMFGLDVNLRYTPEVVAERNGIILGLYTSATQNKIEEPADYSKEAIFSIMDEIKVESSKTEIKPNVIVIMSESFFDPTVLENISYSKDPIPNIRKLMTNYTSGNFISSTFAGGTANIEFEVFTGNSIAYLPYGICPFLNMEDMFNRDIPTIQKDFKRNGYKTVAIHTFDGTFYNRTSIYPKLGFDEFIFKENIEEPKYNGLYISDETFIDKIIEQFEKSNDPLFLYGLSMQNHTPFSMSNFSSSLEIDVDAKFESTEAEDKLKAYIKGIYDTDKTIGRLIEYLENSDRPTVLLFYGDHLPSLLETYEETGFINTKTTTNWGTEELYKTHSIPFFIYDNFNLKDSYLHDLELGAPFLGNYLVNYVGIEKSNYFEFIDTVKYRSIRDRLFVDSEGKSYGKVPENYLEETNRHRIMQYDILHGENYIADYKYSEE